MGKRSLPCWRLHQLTLAHGTPARRRPRRRQPFHRPPVAWWPRVLRCVFVLLRTPHGCVAGFPRRVLGSRRWPSFTSSTLPAGRRRRVHLLRYARTSLGDGLVYNVGERRGVSVRCGSSCWRKLVGAGQSRSCSRRRALGTVHRRVDSRARLAVSRPAALLGCAFLALDSYVISWGMGAGDARVPGADGLDGAAPRTGRGRPTRGASTAAVGAAFVLCRPEAPMFFALLWAGTVLGRWVGR